MLYTLLSVSLFLKSGTGSSGWLTHRIGTLQLDLTC